MNWIKQWFSTPFSDLWLPTIAIGALLIALLGIHWAWLQWRLSRLESSSRSATLNAAAQADAALNAPMAVRSMAHEHSLSSTAASAPISTVDSMPNFGALSDIHALTAQKRAVLIEDFNDALDPFQRENTFSYAQRVQHTKHGQRIEPGFAMPAADGLSSKVLVSAPTQPFDQTDTTDTNTSFGEAAQFDVRAQAGETDPSEGEGIFYSPSAAILSARAQQTPPLNVHPQFHYQARFTWGDALGKQVLNEVLPAHPWPHVLPVVWFQDPSSERSMVAAWQVVNRRELATAEQAEQFKQWCDTIASMGGAQYALLTQAPWESFLDEAHSLLIGLDSVIVLKVSVPLVQLDLFAQSLLAARFAQSQEHWVYQEQSHSATICLERLWQQTAQAQPAHAQHAQASDSLQIPADTIQNAVFQLIIDIPHLDSLEARKVYMRLRAVARASAAILQSSQGAHLSEGMLDRYSRELLLKQEALIKADVPPGSPLAKAVFKPHLGMSSDLGF
jgi:hypothetical protein